VLASELESVFELEKVLAPELARPWDYQWGWASQLAMRRRLEQMLPKSRWMWNKLPRQSELVRN
jgi:hypothetical protein